jgi:hypothetical protein
MHLDKEGGALLEGGKTAAEDGLSTLRELHAMYPEKSDMHRKGVNFFKESWTTMMLRRQQAEGAETSEEGADNTVGSITRQAKKMRLESTETGREVGSVSKKVPSMQTLHIYIYSIYIYIYIYIYIVSIYICMNVCVYVCIICVYNII